MMREEWLQRHGALYYHFRHNDVLFCMLDTQDPVQVHRDYYSNVFSGAARVETMEEVAQRHSEVGSPNQTHRPGIQSAVTRELWDGPMPAAISPAQIDYFREVFINNADARWTVLCMHMPAWQGAENTGFDEIRSALGTRTYTAFAGHVHNYQHREIAGQHHIRLGPTGGAWVLDGDGNADHVTIVSVGDDEPTITTIRLDTLSTIYVDV